MQAVIDSNARLVMNGVIKDRTRPILQYAKITKGKIVSVDGYMFCETSIKTENDTNEGILINPELVKAAKPVPGCSVSGDEKGIWIKGKYTILQEKPSDRFPDTESLKKTVCEHKVEYHAAFMVSTLKKLLGCCPADRPIVMRFRKSEPSASYSRTAIEFISGNIHGIVMPAYVNSEYQEWW